MAARNSTVRDMLLEILERSPLRDSYPITLWANAFAGPATKAVEREYDVQRDEFNVMFVIAAIGPCLATDVCLLNSRPRNSVSRAVRRLETRGMLAREEVAEDRRKEFLSLTEAGQRLYEQVLPIYVARQNLLLEGLDENECDVLVSLLSKALLKSSDWVNTF